MAVAKQQEAGGQHMISQQHQAHQAHQLASSQQMQANCCASCRQPIRDRFIFSVIEQNFHQECVRCADCASNLNERCYTFEGKLYCRSDYWRRFGPKCSACQEAIKPTELVQRLRANLVFHLSCFVCQDCKRHLEAGEQLHLIDEKRLLCKRDFHTLMGAGQLGPPPPSLASQQQQQQQENQPVQLQGGESPGEQVGELADDQDERSSTEGGDSMQYPPLGYTSQQVAGKLDEPANLKASELAGQPDELVDANGKRRGPRTTIKPKQLETLRRAFESAPKPSRHIREQLAAETGLNMRVIQVWFQNRRSKERRMKNSNGSARRNFFRSSSRRIRVGPAGGTPTPGGQQSLIAGGRAAKKAAGSPMEATGGGGEQLQSGGSALQGRGQHSSPSDFGGSSSGGFTYFSDSSNQGDAFAISGAGQTAAPNQQQQQYHPAAASANGPPDQATLMALGSPSSGANPQAANGAPQVRAGPQQQTPPHHNLQQQQQQQHQHQSMKNTPPPPPQMYQPGPPPLMMMQPGPAPLMQHSGPHQMMQTPGLLGHQW